MTAATGEDDGRSSVRRGLSWSTASAIALRIGTFSVGIALARLLSPSAFGVFAVALTVQAILMTLTDLGMSTELVRCSDPKRRAPTVATVSLCAGILLAALMALSSGFVATQFGSPSAAPVLAVMATTLVISACGVVPYAKLQREIRQKELFYCNAADFVVGTGVTLGLVVVGAGPMALAVGRVAAQFAATSLQFRFAGVRPRFGWDRGLARGSLSFGIPVAGANLLSWALLNADNAVIARMAGDVALGYYVLAFNVANWPMSVLGQPVRSVALAAFSRVDRDEAGDDRGRGRAALATGIAATWTAALPVGLLLAVLSGPLVLFLYGGQWAPAAGVLAALAVFGTLRVELDLIATYLLARGAARPVMWLQVLWIVALVPALMAGVHWFGIVGAGWAHTIVAVAVIGPAYVLVARRFGGATGIWFRRTWLATLAGLACAAAAWVTSGLFSPVPVQLLIGGLAGVAVYMAVLLPLVLRHIHTRRPERSEQVPGPPAGDRAVRVRAVP